jgi:transcriptional regulator with XRE-family HTH domain
MRRSELRTRLARARVVAGITQEELSKEAEISIDQIRHFERGAREYPIFTFIALLGVSAEWLAGVGDELQPIGLDGEPYTREKYLEYKARRLPSAVVEQRIKAWKIYLTRLVASVFNEKIDTLDLLLTENLAREIASNLREYFELSSADGRQPLPLPERNGVDGVMRALKFRGNRSKGAAEANIIATG